MKRNKQAILIMAHNNINILKKIITLLDSEYFDLYIHIDKKSDIVPNDLYGICCKSKIYVFKEIKIRWADYSQVECEIFLLDKAIKNKYSYYHLISGVDMPIKTPKEIFEFFEQCGNKEFITFEDIEILENKFNWIKYYYFFGRLSKNSKLMKGLEYISLTIQRIIGIDRIKGNKTEYMNGDNWFSITNELAEYVMSQSTTLKKQYKYTKSSDEIFLHTIVHNSKFKDNLYKKDYNNKHENCMRKIDWERGRPYIFRKSDFDELISTNCMFARKFDEKIDNEIIEALYKHIQRLKNKMEEYNENRDSNH